MELINAKEKRILGALYKLGDASISTIAKETLINRTTLYHTVESLLQKGLLTKVTKEEVAYFQPISLDDYEDWVQRHLTTLSTQAHELGEWLKHQENQLPSLYSDIKYFEGVEGVKNLYADTWRDNPEKIIRAITDYDKAYETFNEFLEKEYFPDRVKHGVYVKSLVPEDAQTGKRDVPRAQKLLRDMGFIKLFKNLSIEIHIYGPKVSIVAFDPHTPSGIIIKNKIIADAFTEIFEYLWKSSKKKKATR